MNTTLPTWNAILGDKQVQGLQVLVAAGIADVGAAAEKILDPVKALHYDRRILHAPGQPRPAS